jgi:hypothetical protein
VDREDLRFDPSLFPTGAAAWIHFHHHTLPLLGMLDYALAAGDHDTADFVHASFEWAKRKGEVTVGYFPENIDSPAYQTSETCEVADMIALALKLSAAGIGDYWDDADRWIRNQFAESQLSRADWIYRIHEGGLSFPKRRIPLSQLEESMETADHVPERNVGAFAGWPSANDFFAGHGTGIMHCCTGNGARALYYIWEHILEFQSGELKVNLLLNRPSKWADIYSHIPYEGRLEVRIKETCRLKVRIPGWVKLSDTICRVNGRQRELRWEGRYAAVDQVMGGEMVEFNFPIQEEEKQVDIEKQHYHLTLKGHDVVDIHPRGKFCPFYQRDHYRDNVPRWKKVLRFVSEKDVNW